MEAQSRKKYKIGLALSGGAALGAAHIGVLKSFRDHGIFIGCISGTSAGAIYAAHHAFGVPIEKIEERVEKLTWLKMSNPSRSKMGLAKNEKLGKFLEDLLGPVNIENAKIPLAIVAMDIKNGKKTVLRRGSLSRAVMASACIPGMFVPVRFGNSQLVDGGVVENLPLSALDEFKPDLKIGVNLMRWAAYKEPKNMAEVFLSAIEIMICQQNINSEILIEPHLEKYNPLDFRNAKELIAEGYRAANSAMPAIKEKIAQHIAD